MGRLPLFLNRGDLTGVCMSIIDLDKVFYDINQLPHVAGIGEWREDGSRVAFRWSPDEPNDSTGENEELCGLYYYLGSRSREAAAVTDEMERDGYHLVRAIGDEDDWGVRYFAPDEAGNPSAISGGWIELNCTGFREHLSARWGALLRVPDQRWEVELGLPRNPFRRLFTAAPSPDERRVYLLDLWRAHRAATVHRERLVSLFTDTGVGQSPKAQTNPHAMVSTGHPQSGSDTESRIMPVEMPRDAQIKEHAYAGPMRITDLCETLGRNGRSIPESSLRDFLNSSQNARDLWVVRVSRGRYRYLSGAKAKIIRRLNE